MPIIGFSCGGSSPSGITHSVTSVDDMEEELKLLDVRTTWLDVYFLILQAIKRLDITPTRGKIYAPIPGFFSLPSTTELVAAFVKLPIDVFCKIMGTHPKIEGMRKSTKYLTSVAASE